jgi:protein SCO1/2
MGQWILAFLLFISFTCLAGVLENTPFKGGVFDPPRLAPDFTLQASDGSAFRLHQYQDKVVLLGFGYTFCPDVCPTTLALLAQVYKNLGEAAKRLQIAYITVDPERDTVERLREYVQFFDKSFLGLTGTAEQLSQVRQDYGVLMEKQVVAGSSGGYLIHHSAFIYVIDPTGRLRLMFPFGMSGAEMRHDLQLLLAGK